MREVTTAKTILINDPLLEATAAAVARIELKVDQLLVQQEQAGRLVIHIGPVREQTKE